VGHVYDSGYALLYRRHFPPHSSVQDTSGEQGGTMVPASWWEAREGTKTVEVLPLLSQYYEI